MAFVPAVMGTRGFCKCVRVHAGQEHTKVIELHPWIPFGYKILVLYITNCISPNYSCDLKNTSPHQVNKYVFYISMKH